MWFFFPITHCSSVADLEKNMQFSRAALNLLMCKTMAAFLVIPASFYMLLPPLMTNYSTPKHSPICVLNEALIMASGKLVCEHIKAGGVSDSTLDFDCIGNALGIHFKLSIHLNRWFLKISSETLWLEWRNTSVLCLWLLCTGALKFKFTRFHTLLGTHATKHNFFDESI